MSRASAIDVSITLLLHLCKGVLEIVLFEIAALVLYRVKALPPLLMGKG